MLKDRDGKIGLDLVELECLVKDDDDDDDDDVDDDDW